MRIQGARAAVTGAATGVGRGIALALADKGAAFVALADIDVERAERTAAEVRARGAKAVTLRVDVRHRADLEALADLVWAEAGGADLLFNNAGVGKVSPAFDIAENDVQWILQVNLVGVINGMCVFGKRMLAAPAKGWICNTASVAGILGGDPMLATYAATKHGVIGYSDSVRADYGDAIGVSVLCPSVVASEMWNTTSHRPDEFGGPIPGDPAAKDFMDKTGMSPEDVGRIAVDGVEAESFFIFSHSYSIDLAERRWHEQLAGSERLWPAGTPRQPVPISFTPE